MSLIQDLNDEAKKG